MSPKLQSLLRPKIVGGAVELMGAAALLLVPEPTLLTNAGGIVLGVHGSDTMSTGLRERLVRELPWPQEIMAEIAGQEDV